MPSLPLNHVPRHHIYANACIIAKPVWGQRPPLHGYQFSVVSWGWEKNSLARLHCSPAQCSMQWYPAVGQGGCVAPPLPPSGEDGKRLCWGWAPFSYHKTTKCFIASLWRSQKVYSVQTSAMKLHKPQNSDLIFQWPKFLHLVWFTEKIWNLFQNLPVIP